MNKLMKVISVLVMSMAAATTYAADPAKAVVDRYNKTCVVCHASGAAGAPRTGAEKEWAPRMKKGMEVLVQSVEKGLNAMPPKGMCFNCTTDEIKALIEYMAAGK